VYRAGWKLLGPQRGDNGRLYTAETTMRHYTPMALDLALHENCQHFRLDEDTPISIVENPTVWNASAIEVIFLARLVLTRKTLFKDRQLRSAHRRLYADQIS
jgi:hypothetical protein